MKKGIASALLFSALLAAFPVWAEGLTAKESWVREAPPGANLTAAYMTLDNPGDAPLFLTGAEAGGFGKAEIHTVVHEGELAKMVPQESLEIPAKGSVVLKPGGYHLMLLEMRQAVQAGQKVPITLILKDGTRIAVEAEVKKDASGHMGGHHPGGHAGM